MSGSGDGERPPAFPGRRPLPPGRRNKPKRPRSVISLAGIQVSAPPERQFHKSASSNNMDSNNNESTTTTGSSSRNDPTLPGGPEEEVEPNSPLGDGLLPFRFTREPSWENLSKQAESSSQSQSQPQSQPLGGENKPATTGASAATTTTTTTATATLERQNNRGDPGAMVEKVQPVGATKNNPVSPTEKNGDPTVSEDHPSVATTREHPEAGTENKVGANSTETNTTYSAQSGDSNAIASKPPPLQPWSDPPVLETTHVEASTKDGISDARAIVDNAFSHVVVDEDEIMHDAESMERNPASDDEETRQGQRADNDEASASLSLSVERSPASPLVEVAVLPRLDQSIAAVAEKQLMDRLDRQIIRAEEEDIVDRLEQEIAQSEEAVAAVEQQREEDRVRRLDQNVAHVEEAGTALERQRLPTSSSEHVSTETASTIGKEALLSTEPSNSSERPKQSPVDLQEKQMPESGTGSARPSNPRIQVSSKPKAPIQSLEQSQSSPLQPTESHAVENRSDIQVNENDEAQVHFLEYPPSDFVRNFSFPEKRPRTGDEMRNVVESIMRDENSVEVEVFMSTAEPVGALLYYPPGSLHGWLHTFKKEGPLAKALGEKLSNFGVVLLELNGSEIKCAADVKDKKEAVGNAERYRLKLCCYDGVDLSGVDRSRLASAPRRRSGKKYPLHLYPKKDSTDYPGDVRNDEFAQSSVDTEPKGVLNADSSSVKGSIASIPTSTDPKSPKVSRTVLLYRAYRIPGHKERITIMNEISFESFMTLFMEGMKDTHPAKLDGFEYSLRVLPETREHSFFYLVLKGDREITYELIRMASQWNVYELKTALLTVILNDPESILVDISTPASSDLGISYLSLPPPLLALKQSGTNDCGVAFDITNPEGVIAQKLKKKVVIAAIIAISDHFPCNSPTEMKKYLKSKKDDEVVISICILKDTRIPRDAGLNVRPLGQSSFWGKIKDAFQEKVQCPQLPHNAEEDGDSTLHTHAGTFQDSALPESIPTSSEEMNGAIRQVMNDRRSIEGEFIFRAGEVLEAKLHFLSGPQGAGWLYSIKPDGPLGRAIGKEASKWGCVIISVNDVTVRSLGEFKAEKQNKAFSKLRLVFLDGTDLSDADPVDGLRRRNGEILAQNRASPTESREKNGSHEPKTKSLNQASASGQVISGAVKELSSDSRGIPSSSLGANLEAEGMVSEHLEPISSWTEGEAGETRTKEGNPMATNWLAGHKSIISIPLRRKLQSIGGICVFDEQTFLKEFMDVFQSEKRNKYPDMLAGFSFNAKTDRGKCELEAVGDANLVDELRQKFAAWEKFKLQNAMLASILKDSQSLVADVDFNPNGRDLGVRFITISTEELSPEYRRTDFSSAGVLFKIENKDGLIAHLFGKDVCRAAAAIIAIDGRFPCTVSELALFTKKRKKKIKITICIHGNTRIKNFYNPKFNIRRLGDTDFVRRIGGLLKKKRLSLDHDGGSQLGERKQKSPKRTESATDCENRSPDQRSATVESDCLLPPARPETMPNHLHQRIPKKRSTSITAESKPSLFIQHPDETVFSVHGDSAVHGDSDDVPTSQLGKRKAIPLGPEKIFSPRQKHRRAGSWNPEAQKLMKQAIKSITKYQDFELSFDSTRHLGAFFVTESLGTGAKACKVRSICISGQFDRDKRIKTGKCSIAGCEMVPGPVSS